MDSINLFLIALENVSIPPEGISLGVKLTLMGTLAVFIGLFTIKLLLDIFNLIYKTKSNTKPEIESQKNANLSYVKGETGPSIKLQLQRNPSLEEVAVIAASLYIQSIEIEAERRYIKAYKRRKQSLHAWKESSKFQLFNRKR